MNDDAPSRSALFDSAAFKNAAFKPSDAALLARVFDEACLELQGRVMDRAENERFRQTLAKRIIDLAAMGERNPDVLKAYAVAALSSKAR